MMNATKRKFHALLQGLSTSSTDPVQDATSLPRTESIAQKRRRLGLPDSIRSVSNKTAPLTSRINQGSVSGLDSGRDAGSDRPRARYCPSDRDELLRRLSTFQEITNWSPKPEKISEVEWAKRGWICQGKERVRCMLCHKEVNVKLKKDNEPQEDGNQPLSAEEAQELREAVVAKFADLIVTEHQEECLWKRRGCEDFLLRLPLASSRKSLVDLRQRYDELCSRKQFLPHSSSLRLPADMDLDDILSQLPSTFFTQPIPVYGEGMQVNRVAIALALLGWQGLTHPRLGAVTNSASCHTCLRRLGLWIFRSKEVDEHGNVVVPAPMDHLDVVWEHRFFCPWKSAKAQAREHEDTQEPGWKVLLQTLRNDAHLRSLYDGKLAPDTHSSEQAQTLSSTPDWTSPTHTRVDPGMFGEALTGADEADDEKARDAKDEERWARLKKVKSLFEVKGSRRTSRLRGRPGTGNSAQSTLEDVTPEKQVEPAAGTSQ